VAYRCASSASISLACNGVPLQDRCRLWSQLRTNTRHRFIVSPWCLHSAFTFSVDNGTEGRVKKEDRQWVHEVL
jgi:hypothetical protein